jgi:hypothetical protein
VCIEENESYRWVFNERNVLSSTEGPAFISKKDNYRAWYLNGKLHRIDGPAKAYNTGYQEYWVDGIHYTENEYPQGLYLSTS